jgi:hypothetical protein
METRGVDGVFCANSAWHFGIIAHFAGKKRYVALHDSDSA